MVTTDVVRLYPSIPHDAEALRKVLELKISTDDLTEIAKFALRWLVGLKVIQFKQQKT